MRAVHTMLAYERGSFAPRALDKRRGRRGFCLNYIFPPADFASRALVTDKNELRNNICYNFHELSQEIAGIDHSYLYCRTLLQFIRKLQKFHVSHL